MPNLNFAEACRKESCGVSKLVPPVEDGTGLGRPASSFDTSFDNDKQDSTYLNAKIV